MDIKLYQFKLLSLFDKGEVLYEHGVHISERKDAEFGYVLYQLNNFYVEVKYSIEGNKIMSLNVFSTTTELEPYLPNIDISNMLSL